MRRWALWQWALVAIFVLFVAAEALVYAQPAPNNCGLNMLCRVKTLIVSGTTTGTSATFSGTLSARTLDGGSIRGTTGNFSQAVVVSDTLSAQTLDGGSIRGTTANFSGALTGTTGSLTGDFTASGTVSVGVLDGGAVIGATGDFAGPVKASRLAILSTAGAGSVTLAGGTGSATVTTGSQCVCSARGSSMLVDNCDVSGTTLSITITGGTTETVNYICWTAN